jgi:hypothetical protein
MPPSISKEDLSLMSTFKISSGRSTSAACAAFSYMTNTSHYSQRSQRFSHRSPVTKMHCRKAVRARRLFPIRLGMCLIHLCKLASKNGCMYSRYADDITFSTNERNFPIAIAHKAHGEPHRWEVGPELQEIVTHSGFAINPEKTRMQYRTSRQDVTGLVVNSKVNIRSEYRRRVRAMAQHLFMTGRFDIIRTIGAGEGALVPTKTEGTLAQLHGMLGSASV